LVDFVGNTFWGDISKGEGYSSGRLSLYPICYPQLKLMIWLFPIKVKLLVQEKWPAPFEIVLSSYK
jgi:hypothetical protein